MVRHLRFIAIVLFVACTALLPPSYASTSTTLPSNNQIDETACIMCNPPKKKDALASNKNPLAPLPLPAATPKHGLSPNLIKAQPDKPSSPFLQWTLVIICTASFYLGPLILLSPLVLYPFHPQAAGYLLCTALFLGFYPVTPWPPFRKMCQLFYEPFDFHHNFTPRLEELAKEGNHLSIIAMHPHAIIPLHGFIWGAICDQLLPSMYGYGSTTVSD